MPKNELNKKSPKNRRGKKSKSPGAVLAEGEVRERKKPGPKPGSKNKPRKPKTMMDALGMNNSMDMDPDLLDNPLVIDEAAKSFTSDDMTGGEGGLPSLVPPELADLDEEQLEKMMMEDEEFGRRQLELAAIEIAKRKKKEEREAKKLEKARQKALEILAAERQNPAGAEGAEGDVPKKKKRGRRSKAEILAEQMRRSTEGGDAAATGAPPPPMGMPPIGMQQLSPGLMPPQDPMAMNISPVMNPALHGPMMGDNRSPNNLPGHHMMGMHDGLYHHDRGE